MQTGHVIVCDPTRHDSLERREIHVDVQRQSVHSNPATHLEAHCAHLLIADPHAGHAGLAPCAQPEGPHAADHHLLQRAHVPVQVLPVVAEVHHGVHHHLSLSVVGHLSPALGAHDVGLLARSPDACVEQHVIHARPRAERVHIRVFQQHHRVRQLPRIHPALLVEPVLLAPRRRILHHPVVVVHHALARAGLHPRARRASCGTPRPSQRERRHERRAASHCCAHPHTAVSVRTRGGVKKRRISLCRRLARCFFYRHVALARALDARVGRGRPRAALPARRLVGAGDVHGGTLELRAACIACHVCAAAMDRGVVDLLRAGDAGPRAAHVRCASGAARGFAAAGADAGGVRRAPCAGSRALRRGARAGRECELGERSTRDRHRRHGVLQRRGDARRGGVHLGAAGARGARTRPARGPRVDELGARRGRRRGRAQGARAGRRACRRRVRGRALRRRRGPRRAHVRVGRRSRHLGRT